ncbi:MAG: toxin [Methylococcaceae bacterium]|nr:toxin [Methylococcaceae bacterium]
MEKLPSFVELPSFVRYREDYLNDDQYKDLQILLIKNPKEGDVIIDAGLRKLRFKDTRRGKGKKGGLRIIYYYQTTALEFLLFTIYSKNEVADLSAKEKAYFKLELERELNARYKANT